VNCSYADHGYRIRTRRNFVFAGNIAQVTGGLIDRAGNNITCPVVGHISEFASQEALRLEPNDILKLCKPGRALLKLESLG